jgi:hypothetical protein
MAAMMAEMERDKKGSIGRAVTLASWSLFG